jgi:DNA transposition AAA+ family ATPase
MRRRTAHENIWRFACYARTQQVLEMAQGLVGQSEPLSVVTGLAGAGKTVCAEHYVSRNAGARIGVCPTRHLSTPRTILLAVAEAVGVRERPRYTQPLYEAVRARLAGGQLFVILDEADQLRAADMDLLRYLAEEADAGFCFLGCPSVLTVLAQRPALQRRVGVHYAIPPATPDEVTRMLASRFDEKTISEIYRQTGGNLGHLERMLRFLSGPESRGQRITPQRIQECAANYLIGAVA